MSVAEHGTPAPSSAGLPLEKPRVSIVVPCYNYSQFLAEAVESALAQTRPADEIIILDDGSSDDSLQVARQYAARSGVRVVAQENQGAVAAFNNCVRASTGTFFVRLDADDRLHPRYLERAVPLLASRGDAGFVYTSYRWFGARAREFPAEPFDLGLLALRPFVVSSALIRRAAFDAVGGYSREMATAYEDWDLFLGMAEHGWHGIALPEQLFDYRIHPGSRNSVTVRQWVGLMGRLYRRHPSMQNDALPVFLARAILERCWRRMAGRAFFGRKSR